MLRSTSAKVLYFVSFEWAMYKLSRISSSTTACGHCSPAGSDAPTPARSSLLACFIAGGLAGGMAWGMNYPTDIVKSRLQTDAIDQHQRQYKGMADCLVKMVREEGIQGLFKGFTPCMIRAVVVNACIFTAFTAVKEGV